MSNNLPKHPDTGFHYIFVLPDTWGSFVDYYAGYQILVRQLPWTSLITSAAFNSCFEAHRDHEDIFFVLWEELASPQPHKCFTVPVYKEAIDDKPDNMLPDHLDHWRRVGALAPGYDGFLAHTPRMADAIGRGMSLPTFVFPAGWSPEAMGAPRKNKHIHHELVYWGSLAGRRQRVIPYLKEQLGNVLLDASGSFGRTLIGIIETAKAALYVAHSNVWSFSTWRLWQGLAAGTPHIAEPGDSWPFVAGKHYIPFTPFSESEEVNRTSITFISNVIKEDVWLQSVADSAYADLAEKFTLQRCVEDYLVPASFKLREMSRE